MAVAYIYFMLLNLVAIVITSGTDVCSCNQCRAHRNRIDRCECCRYYQIGRKRSGYVPASMQVSGSNGKGSYVDQSEEGVSAGQNNPFPYQLEQLRHGSVESCRGGDCISLWPQLKTDRRADGLLNTILVKKSAVNCNLQSILRRGTNRLCQMIPYLNQDGLTAEKFGQEFNKDSYPIETLPQSFGLRFSDRWQTAPAGRDIPVEYNTGEDLLLYPFSLPEEESY